MIAGLIAGTALYVISTLVAAGFIVEGILPDYAPADALSL